MEIINQGPQGACAGGRAVGQLRKGGHHMTIDLNPVNFKARICQRCAEEFMPTGNCAKFCDACRSAARREYLVRYWAEHHERKLTLSRESKRRRQQDPTKREIDRQASYQRKLKRGLIQNPGVGAGKAPRLKGSDHPRYSTGVAYFERNRSKLRQERRYCERCDKDLLEVGRYEWCVHHRDHNPTHNTPENWELLCKQCHQQEHIPKYWERRNRHNAGSTQRGF